MFLLLVTIIKFLIAQEDEYKNMIHLNIIENSSSQSYRIGATIDKNTSGKVILMENTTDDYLNWKDKAVLGYSTFNNNEQVNYLYKNSLDPDAYYCVRLVTDNNEIYYSSPYVKQGDKYVKTTGLEDLDLNNHEDYDPENSNKSYFARHRAGIIVFISLASAVIVLMIYLKVRN